MKNRDKKFSKALLIFLLSAAPIKMHSAFIVMGLCAFSLSEAAPLDLGGGGVYKGAEAQSYFATRYGDDFFTRLAAVMAAAGRAKSGEIAPKPKNGAKDTPKLKFVKTDSDSPTVAAVSESLYRDEVAPRKEKGTSDESDYEEQQTNDI